MGSEHLQCGTSLSGQSTRLPKNDFKEARKWYDHTNTVKRQEHRSTIVRHHVEYSAYAFLTGGTEDRMEGEDHVQ